MSDGSQPGNASQARIVRRNPVLTERIGRNIRLARLEHDYTQRQFGQLIDEWTDSTAVSRWERGKARPLKRTLERIAEVTERDVDWFYAENHSDGVAA